MTDRRAAMADFLATTDWHAAEARSLAGDASNRRYLRLHRPDGARAVLMDAPPDKGEDTRPFTRIARYLTGLGLSAPAILAEDATGGFLILEDLGDALFARVLERRPDEEMRLYIAATDVLVALHHHAPPADLPPYAPQLMADMAALSFDWYLKGATGEDSAARAAFHTTMHDLLQLHAPEQDVLIQRDYHAENLLWLPERSGVARVGLLDFQDARAGHPAYDLVSLLQDARRDVPAGVEMQMIDRYIAATGADDHGFRTAYTVLGVQRNLRILGVFARLSLEYGKPHYVDLIPRVWAHMISGLEHPALAPVADMIRAALPAPTPDNLDRLRPQ